LGGASWAGGLGPEKSERRKKTTKMEGKHGNRATLEKPFGGKKNLEKRKYETQQEEKARGVGRIITNGPPGPGVNKTTFLGTKTQKAAQRRRRPGRNTFDLKTQGEQKNGEPGWAYQNPGKRTAGPGRKKHSDSAGGRFRNSKETGNSNKPAIGVTNQRGGKGVVA